MRQGGIKRRTAWLSGMVMAGLVAGCAGPQATPDGAAAAAAQPASAAVPDPSASAAPTRTVAAPTRYVVKRGDTLTTIARANGCSVQDLRNWNRLGRRGRLAVGQVLKIVARVPAQPVAQTPTPTQTPGQPTPESPSSSASASGATPQIERGAARRIEQEAARHAQRVALAWPAPGAVVENFTPGHNRGIQIAGHAGDPVRAAAAGRVMYAGVGLNGYGTLILVQHNADFLTAYAHSRKLLVKTGDVVRQGDAIAEMGDVDNVRAAVLFEVRRDGRPVDPLPYLPGRQNQG
jgi:lipoprotein NlpD